MTAADSPRLFGTDGVRGAFGEPPLDRATIVALASALGSRIAEGGSKPIVVVGGDTRVSTPEIAAWVSRGLRLHGVEVLDVGVIPTPGVAHLTRSLGAAAGVVISASHNPLPDNGVKILDGSGFKLSTEAETELEQRVAEILASGSPASSESSESRDLDPDDAHELAARYATAVASTLDDGALTGLRVALDAGNGAASAFVGDLFDRCGASVHLVHATPDGHNINQDCGSTAPEHLAELVADGDFDLGFAFDGDADRMVPIDASGVVHDGDAVLFVWASELARRGELPSRSIVATSMSNLGLERALASREIAVVRCDVGDRAVVETLRRRKLRLGGEQSGHLVDLELSTTGDGMLSALQLAGIVAGRARPLGDLLAEFRRYPQRLLSVAVSSKPDFDSLPEVRRTADEVTRELGDDGRLVLRYSGTENVARIMIEGPDRSQVERLTARLADSIHGAIGAV